MASTQQRVAADTCARCRKTFKSGDRVTTAMIVLRTGPNPAAKTPWERGCEMSADFELVHIACTDPGLNGTIIT